MNTNAVNRSKILLTRLQPEEFSTLECRFKKTRFQTMSEYVRALLFDKPITVIYRDQAMDDILEELILLRRELNAIGNNLNQAMHQINSAHGSADSRLWSGLLQVLQSKLVPSTEEIKARINQYAEIWSQKSKPEKI